MLRSPTLPRATVLAILGALISVTVSSGWAATLIVPTQYTTIQAAINAANAGDVVLVEPGTYTANISLRSAIDVRGREAARTRLRPADDEAATVTIIGVSDVMLANFTLIDSPIAVDVGSSFDVRISNNVFDRASVVALNAGINAFADVTNNVFYANAIAIQRQAVNVGVTNNIFRDNTVTITSPLGIVDNNFDVEANCWFSNDDLLVGGVDTSYGTAAVLGDPLFVDIGARDFHLRQGSPCIDRGVGSDSIDDTVADLGAYGGELADSRPFPVTGVGLQDTSTATPPISSITVSWSANLSYLITSSTVPGRYRVHYKQNAGGPPYDGTDAGAGTVPSPVDAGNATELVLDELTPAAADVIAPRLSSASGADSAVTLRWERVAGANGYRVYYRAEAADELQIDVGDVTQYKISGLVNGTTYWFAISALAQATYHIAVTALDSTQDQNESDYSLEQTLRAGPVNESQRSNELSALAERIVAYPTLPDEGGCFIATAAFGADWAAEVLALREFRDRYLATSRPGRWLVAQYYRFSPPLADELRRHAGYKPVVRWALAPFVGAALFMLAAPAPAKLALGALLASLGVSVLRRRRSKASRHRGRLA